ncbi:MAG: hypothetical protein ACE5OQ_01815 [Woeseia sp.]
MRHSPARRRLLRVAALLLALVVPKARAVFAAERTEHNLRHSLTQLAFRLFPHDGLDSENYAEVADQLLRRASGDGALAEMLRSGVDRLDDGRPGSWVERSEAQQIARIRDLQASDFFRLMRTTTIEHLYRNPAAWRLIGYEGSSVEYGGYVDRGFDDIDWLPGEGESR